MHTLRKTTAAFLAVLFIATAVMAILLFNLDRHAFTAETYQQAFAREDFYNKLPNLMARSIFATGTDPSQLPIVMQGMSIDAWEGFIRALLPPDALKTMGDDVLNSTFSYLNLQADSVQFNLTPVKASLLSDAGTQAVLGLLGNLPACTFEQITQITLNFFSGGQVQLCNPPEEVLPLFIPILQGQMQFAASIIPDSLTLVTAPVENDPRLRLQNIRFFMRLSPILPILSLLALTIIAVRSLKDWLNWWGIPFAISGFIAFMMGILGAPILAAVVESILASQMPDYLPAFLLDFTSDFAAAMVGTLLSPVLWQGLILLTTGLVMLMVSYIVNTKGFRRRF